MVTPIHIQGIYRGELLLYALSTCAMCKRVKWLLNEMGVDYSYIDVDLLDIDDKENARIKMRECDISGSFPMLSINNKYCIVGDKLDDIREALSE